MKNRIVIVEDNKLLAAAIEEKLELFSDELEFGYHAENGLEALKMLEKDHAIDAILMDIEMPVMNGIEATEIITEKYPQIKIIILTVFDDEDNIFNAIKAGAKGYLLKDEPPNKIYEGIKIIMEGGAPMSPVIAAKSLEMLRNPRSLSSDVTEEKYTLSKRETEVLEQLSKGHDYNKIAENLFISPSTVRKHIENIYGKLQVHNKMQAVQKAIKHKLI
jgi:DNA-binding NarL/FixJ family response regulator